MPRSDPTAGRQPCAMSGCPNLPRPGKRYCTGCRDALCRPCPDCDSPTALQDTRERVAVRCVTCQWESVMLTPLAGHQPAPAPAPGQPPALGANRGHSPATAARKGKGDGYDSQLERDYAAYLEAQRLAGLVKWWHPHVLTLPTGETVDGEGKRKVRRYRTDFFVGLPAPGATDPRACVPCCDEVKGAKHRGRDRGIAKFDGAANKYPEYQHRLIERMDDGRWRVSVALVGDARKPSERE